MGAVHDAIRHMFEVSGKSQRSVSRALGKDSTLVGSMLTRGSIPRVDTLAGIADECGYELLLRGHGEEIVLPRDDRDA